jgi:hypothetical protein
MVPVRGTAFWRHFEKRFETQRWETIRTVKYYVFKLIAPRSTFMLDMTPEERGLMQSHFGYWRELMAKGMVVVFGPVADPTGPYGLGVIRLDDAIAPDSVWKDDPVIKAQKGFRFHVAPMPNAIHP